MPILFQYINIRHLLGMYITKQAEQEIYLISQKSYDGAPPFPPKKTNSTSQARRGRPFLSQCPHYIHTFALMELLLCPHITLSHLADAFIQSDLHMCDLLCLHVL